MLHGWFTRSAYSPVFTKGAPQSVPIADVPKTVAALAKSFFDNDGNRTNIELHWLYTGTTDKVLDEAWFPRTLGFQHAARDILDGIIDPTAVTLPEIAVLEQSRLAGIRLHSFPPNAAEVEFSSERSTFISKRHLILDRPLSAHLNPDLQEQLMRNTGKSLQEVSESELIDFVLRHPLRKVVDRSLDSVVGSAGALTTLPGSMSCIGSIGTRHANYPLRSTFEKMQCNRYAGSERIVDGHIHEALTRRRIGGDPWLQKLADRYGPVKAAATLSLFDVDSLMQMENLGPHFGVSWVQYAAREIFVIDDDGTVKAHSVLNVDAMSDEQFSKFIQVSKTSLSAPSNAECRLEFHDMIQEFTVQRGVDRPMVFADYAP